MATIDEIDLARSDVNNNKRSSAMNSYAMNSWAALLGVKLQNKLVIGKVRLHRYIRLQGQLSGNTGVCNQTR